MRTTVLAVTALATMALAACEKGHPAKDDLASDLKRASAGSDLTLASGQHSKAQTTVSAIEQVNPQVIKPTTAGRSTTSYRRTTKPNPQPAPVAVRTTTDPGPAVIEAPAPANEVVAEAPAPAPRPHAIPVDMPAGAGANPGSGAGSGIGTVIGVVIRGGVVGGDHCDPRQDGGGTMMPPSAGGIGVAINSRFPVGRGRF